VKVKTRKNLAKRRKVGGSVKRKNPNKIQTHTRPIMTVRINEQRRKRKNRKKAIPTILEEAQAASHKVHQTVPALNMFVSR